MAEWDENGPRTGRARSRKFSATLDDRIIVDSVNAAATLGGAIDSTKAYVINGVVTCPTIAVPAGGITIFGDHKNISKLICTTAGHTMFTGAGAGNVDIEHLTISTTGAGSQVFDLTDSDGTHTIEILSVNFVDCTSLGELNGYRHAFEFDVDRNGGSPSLTLSGTWAGGYRVSNATAHDMAAGFTGALFEEGTSLSFEGRFLIDMGVELPASAALLDLQSSNFADSSLLQFWDCSIKRGGVVDPDDANLTPNITVSDIASAWKFNLGLPNTHVGGRLTITSEAATTVSVQNTWYTLAGTWTAAVLVHTDQPTNPRIRHLGHQPQEMKFEAELTIDGTPSDEIAVRLAIWDDSASTLTFGIEHLREVANHQGGRDVAFISFNENAVLAINDYAYLQVRNTSAARDVTAENGSTWTVEER